jgi:hypothetical protein
MSVILSIVRGFEWDDQAGCWRQAACLKDITELIVKAMDDPGSGA